MVQIFPLWPISSDQYVTPECTPRIDAQESDPANKGRPAPAQPLWMSCIFLHLPLRLLEHHCHPLVAVEPAVMGQKSVRNLPPWRRGMGGCLAHCTAPRASEMHSGPFTRVPTWDATTDLGGSEMMPCMPPEDQKPTLPFPPLETTSKEQLKH